MRMVSETNKISEQFLTGEVGFCYLLLFKAKLREEAVCELGRFPLVRAVRVFANSHPAPYAVETVQAISASAGEVNIWHVQEGCVDPYDLLAMMDKTSVVGAEPGTSVGFPPPNIPAMTDSYVCWQYLLPNSPQRKLDAGLWVGNTVDQYAQLTSEFSRVRWTVSVHPLSPEGDKVLVTMPGRTPQAVPAWQSVVAAANTFNEVLVRGTVVKVILDVWRPLRDILVPGLPPGGGWGGHGELFKPCVHAAASAQLREQPVGEGYCYLKLFPLDQRVSVARQLGREPFWHKVCALLPVGFKSSLAFIPPKDGKGAWHVADNQEKNLFAPTPADYDRVGSTQVIADSNLEVAGISADPVLDTKPSSSGMLVNVPFVAVLSQASESNSLSCPLTAFGQNMDYFESVELVSADAQFTMTGGDGDSVLFAAFTPYPGAPLDELGWVGGAHAMVLSGNAQGATVGDLRLTGKHLFGRQLKGVSVGNLPPVLHVKLDSKLATRAFVRGNLVIRVAGMGISAPVNIGPKKPGSKKPPVGGPIPSPRMQRVGGESSDDEIKPTSSKVTRK